MMDARNAALTHLRSALRLIDEARTPLHIGAQLEFVIHQLEESIVEQDAPGVVRCEEARKQNRA
jgi:hypothetical protein